ncbi:MAG: cytochrome c biogenesis protein CcsA [Bacteroidota bacterium]
MDINYIGEHTFPGQLGNFFVVLALVSSLIAGISYFFAEKQQDADWKQLGRIAFWVHSLSVVLIISIVFYLILNRYFEYDYVWKHSNKQMPLRYIFACFWEGQEGSFLLWMFWHIVIGNILIRKFKTWEAPVLSVFSLVQLFLSSMLLGVYAMGQKIGSNPFLLIRELPENIGLPWTMIPDYISKIPQFQDGRGLNPLLQNYWMTIHPPTLFLGFALTLVPFAFAVSALWRGDLKGWLKPALPWTFIGIGILGVGILMGGAWAYEALNFGGFWAWDPVENASLVPWLTLVGAGHLVIVNTKKDNSIFTALFLSMISFILILYSTFLTRSGVLGETSVHSFTDNGMTGQLLLYLLTFVTIMVALLIRNKLAQVIYAGTSASILVLMLAVKEPVFCIVIFLVWSAIMLIYGYQKYFPRLREEEKTWSREFWMFVGTLVLTLAALQISFSTSTPVLNLLIKPFSGLIEGWGKSTGWKWLTDLSKANFAPPSNAIHHYNKWQIPFAFLTAILIAVTQFFAYKNSNLKQFGKKIASAAVVAVLITALLAYLYDFAIDQPNLLLLLFASVFAICANFSYYLIVINRKFAHAGASIAHIGFAMILLGSLISAGKSRKFSENKTTFDITSLNKEFRNNEDMLLFKGDTVALGDYFVSYNNKKPEGINQLYEIQYFGQKPNFYKAGELVISKGIIFSAKKDHEPTPDFIQDQAENWEMIDNPTSEELKRVHLWNPYRAGKYEFSLFPRIQINEKFGNVPEPATKHFVGKDLYTHIRWAELENEKVDADGYFPAKEYVIAKGDTIFSARNIIVFEQMSLVKDLAKVNLQPNDLAAAAHLKVLTGEDKEFHASPLFILRDSSLQVPDVTVVKEAGLKISITLIDPTTGKITFQVAEHQGNSKEFIVMQAIMFPAINVLWIGIILMALGTFIAILQRLRVLKTS